MRIYHFTGLSPIKKANSALMMCVFQVMFLKRSIQDAWNRFSPIYFPEFRDASFGGCTYLCSIVNCLKGLLRAVALDWYNYDTFDTKSYDYYSSIKNGDINWVVPKKLLALSNPSNGSIELYGRMMRSLGISAVIRLNQNTYQADKFKKLGIRHYDLYFTDGTCPSEEILRTFMKIVEGESGAVAVHCRAGLGRAGTLIACYLMKHYEFIASEAIAWCRLCRPGSILGSQQLFVVEIEETCVKWGEAYKKSLGGSSIFGGKNLEAKIPFRRKSFDLRSEEIYKGEEKEKGQAKMLLVVKQRNQNLIKHSIDDRDAISPPLSYRRNSLDLRNSSMGFTHTILIKDALSYTMASPIGKTKFSAEL